MQPAPSSRARRARLAATVGALVVLLGVVAIASNGGFGARASSGPGDAHGDVVFTLFVIAFAAMIPLGIYAYAVQLRERPVAARGTPLGQLVRIVVFAAALLLAGYVIHSRHLLIHAHSSHPSQVLRPASGAVRPPAPKPRRLRTAPRFDWDVLWVLLALAGGCTAAAVVLRGRRTAPPLEPADAAAETSAAIDDAIEDLEREPDPRRAVIAAYARMERLLAAGALPRRASEAPLEYLARVLQSLGAGGSAVERLTALFEQARFSTHTIDGRMKDAAIGALREIRAGIAG